MGLVDRDDGWRMPDWLWEKVKPLLPPRLEHPLGCHNPRVPDRDAMNAILLVLRTGMQWNALNATGICRSSSAHRRFQEWEQAGVFHEIWRQGLLDYDDEVGIDWSWLAADGAMTKAPLGGLKTGPNPTDRAKGGRSARSSRTLPESRSGSRSGCHRHDMKLLEPTLESVPIARPIPDERRPQGLCLDKGYDYDDIRELAVRQRFEPHIRTRGEEVELKTDHPDWKARRWVAEACHSWFNRNRGVLIRWSKKDENHLAFLQLASGLIAFKKAHAARLAAVY